MNELIFADQELEVGFIEKLDVLLEGIERMGASCKTLPSNEQFLTDKEEPPHLAGLPQQRDDCLLPVGW